jgi:hypothetical protein
MASGAEPAGLLAISFTLGGEGSGAVPIPPAAPNFLAAPQWGQKAKSASHAAPQAVQSVGCLAPQRGQKRKPGDSSKPQPAHAIVIDAKSQTAHHTILGAPQPLAALPASYVEVANAGPRWLGCGSAALAALLPSRRLRSRFTQQLERDRRSMAPKPKLMLSSPTRREDRCCAATVRPAKDRNGS